MAGGTAGKLAGGTPRAADRGSVGQPDPGRVGASVGTGGTATRGPQLRATVGPLAPGRVGAAAAAEGTRAPTRASATALEDPLVGALWTAASLERILAERDYPAALSLALLSRSARGVPGIPLDGGAEGGGASGQGVPDQAAPVQASPGWVVVAEALSAARSGSGGAALERCRGLPDPVEGTLCTVETLTPLLPASVGRELADEGARLVGSYLRPGEIPPAGVAGLPMLARQGGDGLRMGPLQGWLERTLEETISGPLGATLLLGVSGPVGTPFLDSDDPGDDLGVLVGTAALALLPGVTAARAEALSGLVTSLAGISPAASASRILSGSPGLDALVRAHPAVASLEGWREEMLGAPVREVGDLVAGYQRFLSGPSGGGWEAERAFAYLASRSASLAGVEAGVAERIRALGNAAADFRLEGRAFRANLLEAGQQVALSALSGNVFSMAAGVAGFFQVTPGALGPSAASDLRALRGLVHDLRDEMAEGFEAIEARLDELLGEVEGSLARMEVLVASGQREVQGELAAMRDELRALGGRVDRLEANLVTYLEAGFDRDHARTLIRCLEHRERHLPPFDQMEFPVFSGCLTEFRARGARDARDALLTDRTTPVDDLSLAGALSDPDPENLARRLPLLARAAEQQFGYPGMGGGRGGANPVEWAVAAQAYLTMLQDWPEHAARVTPGDLEALLATGVEIQRILEGITVDPQSGERGGALLPVLEAWNRSAAALTEEGGILAARYQQAQLRRVDPTTLLTRMTGEEVGRPILDAPRRVAGNIPAPVRTAAVLALEEPVLVYRMVHTDSITRENPRRRFLFFGSRHDRVTHTRTRMEVELRVGGGEVVKRFRTAGPMVLRRVEEIAGDTTSQGVRRVEDRIADPGAHFLETAFPALASDVTAWQLVPPDPFLLRRLEAAIEEELRRFESASLNRVFSSACLGPAAVAAADLTPEDRDSALRVSEALDRMTTARILLDALLRLGLPEALESDPRVAEALSGENGLLDRGSLCRVVAAGESPLRVVWLEEEPTTRARELRILLDEALQARAEGLAPASVVDATLQQLRAAIRIQQLRARVAG